MARALWLGNWGRESGDSKQHQEDYLVVQIEKRNILISFVYDNKIDSHKAFVPYESKNFYSFDTHHQYSSHNPIRRTEYVYGADCICEQKW